jgi:hypothetical protein
MAPPPVDIAIYAIYATNENRPEPVFDPALAPVRHAVSDLAFDTFTKIRADVVSAPFGEETAFPINDKYSLYVKPLNRQDIQTRMEVRVELAPRSPQERPRTAVTTTVVMAPSRQVKLRGLKMDKGELVIVLALK